MLVSVAAKHDLMPEHGLLPGSLEEQIAKFRAHYVPGKPLYDYPVSPQEIARLAPAGLRFFKRFAAHLRLSQAEMMALLGLREESELPAADSLSQAEFYRLSYLIGIWTDAVAALGNKDAIVRWLRMPIDGAEYGGRSRIDYLIAQGLPGFDHVRREAANWALDGW